MIIFIIRMKEIVSVRSSTETAIEGGGSNLVVNMTKFEYYFNAYIDSTFPLIPKRTIIAVFW